MTHVLVAAERNIKNAAWGKSNLNVKGVIGVWIKKLMLLVDIAKNY